MYKRQQVIGQPQNVYHSVRSIPLPPRTMVNAQPASTIVNAQPARTFVSPRPPITINDQISVYCPVCRRDFYNSQVEQHAMIHDAAYQYNFKMEDQQKDLNVTQDSINDSQKLAAPAKSPANVTQYPLI